MTTFDTSLLPPLDEDEESRPAYRRVWRTTMIETLVLIIGTLVVNLAASLLNIHVDVAQRPPVTAALALTPLGLWFLFSWRGERRALNPRNDLVAVLVVSLLVANAVAGPFIEVFIEPGRWLNSLPGISRILGYMVTVGLAVETLKYLVLRYMAWPGRFQQRIDSIAYGLVVSLAFATVFNLRFALLEGGAQPGAAAIRIVSTVLAHEGIGLIVSYRLMTLKQGRGGMLSLSIGLLFASFLYGVYVAFRAGFTVSAFGIGATANAPLLGFGFSVAFGLFLFAVHAFLISSADARDVRMSHLE